MCEIFSAIGTALLSAASATGAVTASTAASTAIGAAATGAAVAGLTGAGVSIANGIRSARDYNSSTDNLLDRNKLSTERTASQLKENSVPKRTITSLRIPLDKTISGLNTQSSQTISGTGLNIPT